MPPLDLYTRFLAMFSSLLLAVTAAAGTSGGSTAVHTPHSVTSSVAIGQRASGEMEMVMTLKNSYLRTRDASEGAPSHSWLARRERPSWQRATPLAATRSSHHFFCGLVLCLSWLSCACSTCPLVFNDACVRAWMLCVFVCVCAVIFNVWIGLLQLGPLPI